MDHSLIRKYAAGSNPAFMKASSARWISICLLALVLGVAGLPWVEIVGAGTNAALNEQLAKAVKSENLTLVKRLLKKGADGKGMPSSYHPDSEVVVAAVDNGRLTPERLHILKLLLDNGADVNATRPGGEIPLMAARDPNAVKLLLEKGADVNARGETGKTVLMIQASNENADVVKLLLDIGADVNAKSKDGESALMIAVEAYYADIVKLLLEKGVEVNVTDERGMTALRRAEIRNDQEIMDMLKQAVAKDGSTEKDQTASGETRAGLGTGNSSMSYYPGTPEGVVEAFIREAIKDVPITVEEMRSSDDIFLVQEKYFIRLAEGRDQPDGFPESAPTFNIATGYTIKKVHVEKEEATVTVLYNRLGWIWGSPVNECRLGEVLTQRLRELRKSRCKSAGDRSRFLNISNDTQEVTYTLRYCQKKILEVPARTPSKKRGKAQKYFRFMSLRSITKAVDKWRLVDSYFPYISVNSAIKLLEYKLKEASRKGERCPSEEQKQLMKQDIRTLEHY